MRRAKGTISVFTFKEGILARAAHDLALHTQRFDIALDGEQVTATLPLAALVVIGPVEGGVIRAELYDAGRRAEVEQAMHSEVLHTARNPTARFDGRAVARGAGFVVTGRLSLAGQNAPLAFDVIEDSVGDGGHGYRARCERQPSRWGIAPYKATLVAIRLKDVIRIELALTEETTTHSAA